MRIVKGRPVNVALHFIEDGGRKCVLQRQQIVRRTVDDLNLVAGEGTAVGAVDQADVALRTPVERSSR